MPNVSAKCMYDSSQILKIHIHKYFNLLIKLLHSSPHIVHCHNNDTSDDMYIYSLKTYSGGDMDSNWQFFFKISVSCLSSSEVYRQIFFKDVCSVCLIDRQICFNILTQLPFHFICALVNSGLKGLLCIIKWIDLDLSYQVNIYIIPMQIQNSTFCLVHSSFGSSISEKMVLLT